MRVALDTNVMVYAEGVNGPSRRNAVLDFLDELPRDQTFVPVQALGELFAVLVRKAGRSPARSRDAVLSWQDVFGVLETSAGVLAAAMELAAAHNLGVWDAIILSAASAAGCRYLLSEDLQDGFTWNGVTVVNPFAGDALARVLGE